MIAASQMSSAVLPRFSELFKEINRECSCRGINIEGLSQFSECSGPRELDSAPTTWFPRAHIKGGWAARHGVQRFAWLLGSFCISSNKYYRQSQSPSTLQSAISRIFWCGARGTLYVLRPPNQETWLVFKGFVTFRWKSGSRWRFRPVKWTANIPP